MADPNQMPEFEPVPSKREEMAWAILGLIGTVLRIGLKAGLALLGFVIAFIAGMTFWRK